MVTDRLGAGDDAVVTRLRAAGCVFAEDEASLLRRHARSAGHLAELVARRTLGEPLEHLLGRVELDGLELAVTAGVFVPRQRTTLLARHAVRAARDSGIGAPTVVELCCGVAPVAAVVARDVPHAQLFAADIDPDALACAARNVPTARICAGDLYDALPDGLAGAIDVLAVNAPYVPSSRIRLMPPEARLHEPLQALDGGPDGTDVQARVIAGAPTWLAPGGIMLIETGREQSTRTMDLISDAGLRAQVLIDDDLDATVVRAQRRPGPHGREPR